MKRKVKFGKPKRFQFEATPELTAAIEDLANKMNTTVSFVCRTGLAIFMQDHGFVEKRTDILERFITPVNGKVINSKGERK